MLTGVVLPGWLNSQMPDACMNGITSDAFPIGASHIVATDTMQWERSMTTAAASVSTMSRPLYIYLLVLAPAAVLILVLRLLQVIEQTHAGQRRRRPFPSTSTSNSKQKCRIVAFLGSGGHTGEMIRLLYSLDYDKYPSRLYLVSSGDHHSLTKAKELEAVKSRGKQHGEWTWTIKQIPRARRVHQSFLTAPFTTLRSLWACVALFTLPSFYSTHGSTDLILLNGPGSCVPIVLAAFVPRLFNLQSPQIIYIESFARVQHLSLSGKILQYFVDRFLVQWPGLADNTENPGNKRNPWRAKREYQGLLV